MARASCRRSSTCTRGCMPGDGGIKRASAMAGQTSLSRSSAERSTSQAPPEKDGSSDRASSIARRVLPIPPGPTRVINLDSSASSASSSSSRSRPRKELRVAGKLPPALSRLPPIGGKVLGRSDAQTWCTRMGSMPLKWCSPRSDSWKGDRASSLASRWTVTSDNRI